MNRYLILFCFFLFLAGFSQAQSQIQREMKRMGLENSDLAISSEVVQLFPRGFIYDVSEPDSVYYFGCFSSDLQDVEDYFNGNYSFKRAAGNRIIRGIGDFNDTIYLYSLTEKLTMLKTFDNSSTFTTDENAEYVIFYYWSPKLMDRFFRRNIKALKKFDAENPEKKIQMVFVLVG
jgi:hypothetical protein